jgi:hypothetical protein
VVPPQMMEGENWFQETTDAVYQNRELLLSHSPDIWWRCSVVIISTAWTFARWCVFTASERRTPPYPPCLCRSGRPAPSGL